MSTPAERTPLEGLRVLVTRPSSRSAAWIDAFRAVGAEVVSFPVFELVLPDPEGRRAVLGGVDEIAARGSAWVGFTSVPAVESLCTILDEAGRGGVLRERFRVACVGPATRAACEERGLAVTLEPVAAAGAELARALLEVDPRPALLHPTSARGLTDLEDAVRAAGGVAMRVIVCVPQQSPESDPSRLARQLAAGGIDLLTFASPSGVEGLMSLATAEAAARLRELPANAVGPTTEQALRQAGFQNTRRAASPRVGDVVRGAIDFMRPRR